ncbi:MAG: FAD:protein FMN transferase [Deltaproteobacteria bacterium]|nr:FAD:protein FMN transferase [Deltaproteobacteria bacterium]
MNTDVAVIAPGRSDRALAPLAAEIAALFAASERRFSRFDPDSELSRLNRATAPMAVSRELFLAVRRARSYAIATHGLFDPGVGAALIASGYDRSFAPGALDRPTAGAAAPASVLQLELDAATRTVVRPPGVTIDLGGMAKGLTVDRAAALGTGAFAVDAGGDAMLRGDGPDGDGWIVDVEDPRDPARVIASLRVRDRAVATSAPNRRWWRVGGAIAHHLIDPRTGRAAASDLLQATVVAPTAELADVLAKTAFLLGARAATRFLDGRVGLGAVLVDRGGGVALVGEVELVTDVGCEVADA